MVIWGVTEAFLMSSLRGVLRFLEVYLWRRVEGSRRFEPEGRGANVEVGQEGSAGSNRQKPALCRRGVHRNDIGPSVHRFDPADRCDSNDLSAPRASRSFQCHFCGHRRGDALIADQGRRTHRRLRNTAAMQQTEAYSQHLSKALRPAQMLASASSVNQSPDVLRGGIECPR